MFKRLKKNGKRGMSIVEYGILIAVIATVASRAYPFLVQHLLGNTQKQVERMPSYSTWQMNETNDATRTQQITKEVLVDFGIGEDENGFYWWEEEALKSAALIERDSLNAGFGRGPGHQQVMDGGVALADPDLGVGLDEGAGGGAPVVGP